MNRFNKIAVLIPTINETTLEDVVTAAITQIPKSQIYILGFGESRNIAERLDVNFVDLGEKTRKSIALNRAVSEITSDWFFILDADAIPQHGWAENLASEFECGRQIFSGSVDISRGNKWMRAYNISMLHEFLTSKPPGFRQHLPALNLGFTREFFNRNGPFSELIIRSQDYEWTLRAFKNQEMLYFSPGIVVQHIPVNKNSFRSVLKYWKNSGYEGWLVRMEYKEILKTPFFMDLPWFILFTSPILGLMPTLRILKSAPMIFLKNLHLIPLIYLTKVAWCIGVYTGSHSRRLL